MDSTVGLLWFIAFSTIVIVLGTLNYFLGRTASNITITNQKSSTDLNNSTKQSNRSTNNNHRKKHSRSVNKKHRQQTAPATNENLNHNDDVDDEDQHEIKTDKSHVKITDETPLIEPSVKPIEEEEREQDIFYETFTIDETSLTSSSQTQIQDEQNATMYVKQRNKNKSSGMNNTSSNPAQVNSPKEEPVIQSKPQASVAPVKQTSTSIATITNEFSQSLQDNNSKSHTNLSSPCNSYLHSENESVPPRFRQQTKNSVSQKSRQNKSKKKSSNSIDEQNNSIKSIDNNNNNNTKQQHEQINQIGYSSESDILSECRSTSHVNTNDNNSSLSTSTESQHSLKGLDLLRSLSTPKSLLDKLISIFDTVSFSSDEIESILNKIAKKYLLNKQESQHSLSTTIKNDKTIEQLIDETYHRQIKILALELQTEKSRVFDLTKSNAEMDNRIRHLQQSNHNMIPYQQTVLSYQMQIRRLTDENGHLVHQLHTYSMMPSMINELKQQQNILNEQIRQLTNKNNTLEQEIADVERAGKQAADIYKKSDLQKQERIEQMTKDIHKYKKIDKDLITLRQKHAELEKNLNSKLNNVSDQRDQLKISCEQLNEKLQLYEQSKLKSDQINHDENSEQIKKELDEVRTKNDILRQRNWKIMEQLNKLKEENISNQSN